MIVLLLVEVNAVDGQRLTFAEVISLSFRLSRGLTTAGFQPRDRLLMICRHNVTEYAPLFFAVARCRGHLAALSPSATDGQPHPPLWLFVATSDIKRSAKLNTTDILYITATWQHNIQKNDKNINSDK